LLLAVVVVAIPVELALVVSEQELRYPLLLELNTQ
jgi:hypothetical protein